MGKSPAIQESASTQAAQLARLLLGQEGERIVFAESCTAGLVAALLAQVPGISKSLCGSAVTYQESVKIGWLDVNEQTLKSHTAESLATTKEMALGVLAKTSEATIAAAVTGHLGPGAPNDIDGNIFIVVAQQTIGSEDQMRTVVSEETIQLDYVDRVDRQFEAAQHVLRACCAACKK